MQVHEVLSHKAEARPTLITVRPSDTVAHLVATLADHKIGAVIVSDGSGDVSGIVSERDVIRGLAEQGNDVMSAPVSDLMTRDVRTCSVTDEIREIATTMTTHRFRHLPVLEDGDLIGIVSIGDVVKSRIDELEDQADHLVEYLFTA